MKDIITEKKYSDKLKELMKKPKFLQVAVIIGLAAMGLIFISGLSKPKQEAVSVSPDVGVFTSSDEYAEKLQAELEEIISKIEGVGDSDILVTIGVSEEYVYAEDGKQGTGSVSSEVVVIDGDGGKHALTQKIISPKITGVVIVCEGGDDSRTVEKVYKAVSAATGIGASRIYVAERK